jgi:hypothetical protein
MATNRHVGLAAESVVLLHLLVLSLSPQVWPNKIKYQHSLHAYLKGYILFIHQRMIVSEYLGYFWWKWHKEYIYVHSNIFPINIVKFKELVALLLFTPRKPQLHLCVITNNRHKYEAICDF